MRQYGASPVLQALNADWENYFGQDWINQFYDVVWNVDTAEGFGLDIWGRIVGVGRNLNIPQNVDYFGFNAAPQWWSPFGDEAFYAGPAVTQTFTLSDPAYRVLILAKALGNVSATDSKSLNENLLQLFPGRGNCYVNDLGAMSMRYVFEFALEPWEASVITAGGVLPRPAGVQAYLIQFPQGGSFGFAEAGDSLPFNDGTFLNNGALINAA